MSIMNKIQPENDANAASFTIPSLPKVMLEPLVRGALCEDLGRAGDLTSDAIVPMAARARMCVVARQAGVLAGLDLLRLAFRLMDESVEIRVLREDGARLAPGDVIAVLEGRARAMLSAERTALNFLGHLSGVATATASIADAIRGYGTRVSCTRKTLPGLRTIQKYAVRVGGGSNHRYGLDDAVLIKDNHISVAGSVGEAILRARAGVGHMVRIQLEVDTLAQLKEGLDLGIDAVLLDNMSVDTLNDAVRLVAGRAVTEASGRITPATAPAIAQTGVNLIAVGWLTHSAPVLDIGLDADYA
ncbi:nicotinate-nucleotide diphosphorylase (carboxylating) [Pollutimonas subterranea]|uniref:Probable nicotinate-nucleotide pyrophosphorylase [carboxylating] n=1 Tax=Pollutimonas subterranea TaxID=2045210 RepID=A0A2N4U2V1_9BURK|nr:carboxylating nicotinate-nucleotide diphosphorylase [Pollutimonas subterranea]PLC49349.1 nicotinate-nucleotide diphosphorylase (carboxylating) [Pollutimonas subterranea]